MFLIIQLLIFCHNSQVWLPTKQEYDKSFILFILSISAYHVVHQRFNSKTKCSVSLYFSSSNSLYYGLYFFTFKVLLKWLTGYDCISQPDYFLTLYNVFIVFYQQWAFLYFLLFKLLLYTTSPLYHFYFKNSFIYIKTGVKSVSIANVHVTSISF